MTSDEALKREYGAFKNTRTNYPKYVFSLDKIDSSHDGITHINILDFLEGKTNI